MFTGHYTAKSASGGVARLPCRPLDLPAAAALTVRRAAGELLFDNQADPCQLVNLADDPRHAERREHFRRMLKRRMAELSDTFEQCTWYRDHWTEDRNILRGARGGTHDLKALNEILRRYFPEAGGA
jgi:hypothetical protein